MAEKSQEFWVRDGLGNIFGPQSYATVELFVENDMFKLPVSVSEDGLEFVEPGQLPALRNAFPLKMWGSEATNLTQVGNVFGGAGQGTFASQVSPSAPPAEASSRDVSNIGPLFEDEIAPAKAQNVARHPSNRPFQSSPGISVSGEMRFGSGRLDSGRMGSGRLGTGSAASVGQRFGSAPPSALRTGGLSLESVSPPPPALTKSGMPVSGEVTMDFPALRICHRLIRGKETGLLKLDNGVRNYSIYFHKGNIEALSTSRPDESFVIFALMQKQITESQLGAIQSEGGDELEAILRLQIMPATQAMDLMTHHRSMLLFKAILLTDGTYSFDANAVRPSGAQSLGDGWAPLAQSARAVPREWVAECLGDKIDRHIMPSGGATTSDVTIDQFGLNAMERRIFAKFNGTKTLVEICDGMTDAQILPVLRTAYVLSCFEFVSFSIEVHKSPASMAFRRKLLRGGSTTLSPSSAPSRFSTPSPVPRMATPTSMPRLVVEQGPSVRYGSNHSNTPRMVTPIQPGKTISKPPRINTSKPFESPEIGNVAPRQPTPSPVQMRQATQPPTQQVRQATQPPVQARQATQPPNTPPKHQTSPSPQVRLSTNPPASGPSSNSDEVTELKKVLSSMAGKNHFEVLGMPQDAQGSAYKFAFFKMAKKYHPDTAVGASSEVAQLKSAIFSRVNEAYQVLDNPKKRQEYAESLVKGEDVNAKVDVAAILASEEKYLRATTFMKARRYKDAVSIIEEAIALNPLEGEFVAARGFANFMAASDKFLARASAVADIDKGLQISPNSAASWVFYGQVEKVLGNNSHALECFKKAVELAPNNEDAKRELRWMKMKK